VPPGAPGRRRWCRPTSATCRSAPAAFDVAFSAYGALPFVADAGRVLAGVAAALRPGGRWVFSVTHPFRWSFPDDPGPRGLTVGFSYFDRTPYVEQDGEGRLTYAEHHRTVGDWVRLLVGRRLRGGRRRRAGVAGRPRARLGRLEPAARAADPGTAVFVTHLRDGGNK
jgi:hypothetical protein